MGGIFLEIEFYVTESGDLPVKDFIARLHPKQQAKVLRTIDLLKEYGANLREPYVKPLTGHRKLFELRTRFGKDYYRILYFAVTGRRFVLLHGVTKKAKRLPPREIETAKDRMVNYLRRFEK